MLSLSTDLVLSGWKRYACQRIRRSESEKVARVSGFGVASLVLEMLKASDEFTAASLETLCVSMDFVFSVWKRHACQRIWCSTFRHMLTFWKCCHSGNTAPVNGFNVRRLETLHVSAHYKCFGGARLETLCLLKDLVFSVWKRGACQRIWCSESGNVASKDM